MRTYLLLKERARAFRADPEVQQAMADAGIPELATPTLAPGESLEDLLRDTSAFEDFDVDRAGARPHGATRLDQLAIEHLSAPADATGGRRRLVDLGVQGRGPRRRLGCARRHRARPHPPTTPPRSEQDPGRWWDAFERACADAGVLGRNRPAAIAVAGQQHGLVVLDAAGHVLRPAKLWNDTESAPDAEALVAALGAPAWAAACGSVPVASFTITKLRWLRRCEPDAFARIGHVLLPHDWLTRQLTGATTTDRGDASGTGWWSPGEERYRYDLLSLVDDTVAWDALLPEVLGPTEPAGRWDGIVVGPGTGDNMAAALGLGLRPGTSRSASARAAPPPASASSRRPTARAPSPASRRVRRFLPLVCTLNATKVTDAVGRLLGVDAAGLDALALTAAPGSGGLVLVPHLDGERTPDRPGATGSLHGDPLGRVARAARPGRRRRRRLQPARRGGGRCRTCAVPRAGASCSSVAAPAAPPTDRSSPTSPAAPSSCRTTVRRWREAPPCRRPPCSPAAGSTTSSRRGTRGRRRSSSPIRPPTAQPSVPRTPTPAERWTDR
jgi:xylulokinase